MKKKYFLDFGENEAKVFCRSLGYDGAAVSFSIFIDSKKILSNNVLNEGCHKRIRGTR